MRRSEDSARVLTQCSRVGSGAKAYPPEPCQEVPVAIVALGCVLPGAANAEEFWRNTLNGVNGRSAAEQTCF